MKLFSFYKVFAVFSDTQIHISLFLVFFTEFIRSVLIFKKFKKPIIPFVLLTNKSTFNSYIEKYSFIFVLFIVLNYDCYYFFRNLGLFLTVLLPSSLIWLSFHQGMLAIVLLKSFLKNIQIIWKRRTNILHQKLWVFSDLLGTYLNPC